MRELKSHFEIFIKVMWLLIGEAGFFLVLCKEIVKKSQKFHHKQVCYKINDKFAFSESASGGIFTPNEALFKKIEKELQNLNKRSLTNFLTYLNLFFPFTFINKEVLTAKAFAYAK